MQFLLAFISALFFFQMASGAAVSRPARGLTGFVETDGKYFSLDGYKYTVVGANAYWIGLAGLTDEDIDKSFADIAGMGATTVRVWGFNEMDKSHVYGKGIYYQIWDGDRAVINYSETGLGYFDRVVASAKKHNLKLIVVLTSNYNGDWIYGGIETYITQVLGRDQWRFHDVFFTDPKIKAAYKNYITAVVNRYKNERTIMSWELGHQLKNAVAWNPQNPASNPAAITSWIKEMSSHIKSIDSNHLVAAGDEGFFNRKGNSKWTYNGRDGIDFEANIRIDSIDYGTFAYRPASYEMPTHSEQPLTWIEDHAKVQKSVNKPVLLIDIGLEIRPQWLEKVVATGISGFLYWQAGTDNIHLDMPYWFLGDSIEPGGDTYELLKKHAKALKSRP